MSEERQTAETAALNTDRELFREDTGERAGSHYENSLHVTAQGAVGMNVGGTVYTLPISRWHALAAASVAEVDTALTDGERETLAMNVMFECPTCGHDYRHHYNAGGCRSCSFPARGPMPPCPETIATALSGALAPAVEGILAARLAGVEALAEPEKAPEPLWFNDLCDCDSEGGRFGPHRLECPTMRAREDGA